MDVIDGARRKELLAAFFSRWVKNTQESAKKSSAEEGPTFDDQEGQGNASEGSLSPPPSPPPLPVISGETFTDSEDDDAPIP